MDELKERYDQLDELKSNLEYVLDNCDLKEYIPELMSIIESVQNDINDIEPQIQEYEKEENNCTILEFRRDRI